MKEQNRSFVKSSPCVCSFSIAFCLFVDYVGTAVVWMLSGEGGIINCRAGSVDKTPPCQKRLCVLEIFAHAVEGDDDGRSSQWHQRPSTRI
ncbi:hypothetical protein QQF64_007406 [Cirrhinus molitorella]|uniref:Uncharacterized protein n=1 Tax=Cirrhinus molitorella TaxID=172907 RepID=A0ABR3MCV0_9TELE